MLRYLQSLERSERDSAGRNTAAKIKSDSISLFNPCFIGRYGLMTIEHKKRVINRKAKQKGPVAGPEVRPTELVQADMNKGENETTKHVSAVSIFFALHFDGLTNGKRQPEGEFAPPLIQADRKLHHRSTVFSKI